MRKLIQYAQTARRAADQVVRDAYEGSFATIRPAMLQVQIDIQFPGSVLEGALGGMMRNIFLSGSDGVIVYSRPVQAPEVRADVIFDRIFEWGTRSFGSMQGINQILGRLYSVRVEVKTLSAAYEKIGARLDKSKGSSFMIRAWFDFFNESAGASVLSDGGLRAVCIRTATDRSVESTWQLVRRIF